MDCFQMINRFHSELSFKPSKCLITSYTCWQSYVFFMNPMSICLPTICHWRLHLSSGDIVDLFGFMKTQIKVISLFVLLLLNFDHSSSEDMRPSISYQWLGNQQISLFMILTLVRRLAPLIMNSSSSWKIYSSYYWIWYEQTCIIGWYWCLP